MTPYQRAIRRGVYRQPETRPEVVIGALKKRLRVPGRRWPPPVDAWAWIRRCRAGHSAHRLKPTIIGRSISQADVRAVGIDVMCFVNFS